MKPGFSKSPLSTSTPSLTGTRRLHHGKEDVGTVHSADHGCTGTQPGQVFGAALATSAGRAGIWTAGKALPRCIRYTHLKAAAAGRHNAASFAASPGTLPFAAASANSGARRRRDESSTSSSSPLTASFMRRGPPARLSPFRLRPARSTDHRLAAWYRLTNRCPLSLTTLDRVGQQHTRRLPSTVAREV